MNMNLKTEVGAGAFFALTSAKPKKERKSAKKKERESAKKKEREKSESAERKRKKSKFALFPPQTVKNRFQSPKPFGRGGKQGS
jgi:hypothetical protein